MCGIAGMLYKRDHSRDEAIECLHHMIGALRHRGPDDNGTWIDSSCGVYLGHARLAILELSDAGKQPMVSASGRYVVIFNGEIYNYRELRTTLENSGIAFRGGSDTEVLLQMIEMMGFRRALDRYVGMFAFAVWDKVERTLNLVVDRMGEKPLYYGWVGGAFLFGSELSIFRVHGNWKGEIDDKAFQLYVRHGYVPAPFSIYKGVGKILPGEVVSVRFGDDWQTTSIEREFYWRPHPFVSTSALVSGKSDEEEISDLETLLKSSVRGQMVADVPVGAFLSGGVDSSLIVALMQSQSQRPVKTFTIGLEDSDTSEAAFARTVATHLGTDHTELIVTGRDALDIVPKMPFIFDEPFADSSQIPTYLVSKLARSEVTVSLSGDGADELFGGYRTYGYSQRMWNNISRVPRTMRCLLRHSLTAIPNEIWLLLDRLRRQGVPRLACRVQHLCSILEANSLAETHYRMVSSASVQMCDKYQTPLSILVSSDTHEVRSILSLLTLMDIVSYLPGDILVKVDRAAMAVSLETRVPMLDLRVVESALRMRDDLKVRKGITKWALRQILYKYVPAAMIERPKRGFSIPIAEWLRGPLHDWAHEIIKDADFECYGSFSLKKVQRMWTEHIKGHCDGSRLLWSLLMFRQWVDAQH